MADELEPSGTSGTVKVPRAWTDLNGEQVRIQIPEAVFKEAIECIENGLENANELLQEHLRSLGETTKKNRAIADMYRNEITKASRLLLFLRTR
jgi:hypothetical protein